MIVLVHQTSLVQSVLTTASVKTELLATQSMVSENSELFLKHFRLTFAILGTCTCTAGYIGEHCQSKCGKGVFGFGCKYNCDCFGANTKSCDFKTGICTCEPGFFGSKCEHPVNTCSRGKFGSSCSDTCDCNNMPCDRSGSSCVCETGHIGDKCDKTVRLFESD